MLMEEIKKGEIIIYKADQSPELHFEGESI